MNEKDKRREGEINFKVSKNYIVYDIGGTYIKWSVTTSEYEIIEDGKFFFDCAHKNCNPELLDIIGNQISSFVKKYQNIHGIGISTAGDVNTNSSEIIGSVPNHKNYVGTNFKKELLKYSNLPVAIDNDANCAVLGEYVKGVLSDIDNGILITLGTDIGGGILIDKKIYRGCNGSAGEVGYMDILNKRWGTWFSALGLSRLVCQRKKINISPEEILKNKNEQFTNEIYYWYSGLSKGIANLIALFNPEKLVIGGGLSESNLLNLNIINKLKNKVLVEKCMIDKTEVVLSKNGNKSALYGCIKLLNDFLK